MSKLLQKLIFPVVVLGYVIAFSLASGEAKTRSENEIVRDDLAPLYPGAKIEYRLWDLTRVDLLTESHAIEVDWPVNWAESIGQSVYYSILTNRRAGIILLLRDGRAETMASERRYIYRCQTVCAKENIHLWIYNVARGKFE